MSWVAWSTQDGVPANVRGEFRHLLPPWSETVEVSLPGSLATGPPRFPGRHRGTSPGDRRDSAPAGARDRVHFCRPIPRLRVDRGVRDVPRHHSGADDGIRTRDPNLGKVVLYQLSHVRVRGPL